MDLSRIRPQAFKAHATELLGPNVELGNPDTFETYHQPGEFRVYPPSKLWTEPELCDCSPCLAAREQGDHLSFCFGVPHGHHTPEILLRLQILGSQWGLRLADVFVLGNATPTHLRMAVFVLNPYFGGRAGELLELGNKLLQGAVFPEWLHDELLSESTTISRVKRARELFWWVLSLKDALDIVKRFEKLYPRLTKRFD